MKFYIFFLVTECILAVYNIEQCDNCGLEIQVKGEVPGQKPLTSLFQTEIKCPRNLPQFCDFASNCEAVVDLSKFGVEKLIHFFGKG